MIMEIEHPQPLCENPRVFKRGKSEAGTQRYECRTCHITWTGNIVGRPPRVDLTCPKCGKDTGKKNGKDAKSGGKQKYLCKSCGHAWLNWE